MESPAPQGAAGTPAASSTPTPGDRDGRTRVEERLRVRRPLGRAFWAVGLLVPVALTAVVGVTQAAGIEAAVTGEAQAALGDAGLDEVVVVADGRTVTAKVPTGRDPRAVVKTLESVPAVAMVTVRKAYSSPAEAKACKALPKDIERVTRDQQIPFAGSSPSLTAEGERMVREVAGLLKECRAAVVIVGGHTDPATSNGASLSLERARRMVALLKKHGVAGDRLEARGYGDQFPLVDDADLRRSPRNERGSIVVQER